MKTSSTRPGIGQWLLVLFLAAVSFTAGGASMYLNWTFGLGISMIAAIIFVFMDALKIMIPFVVKTTGAWNMRYRAAWLVALIISMTAASSHLLKDQAQAIKDARAHSVATTGARADQDRARAELAKITETMSVTALTDLAAEAKAKAADAEKAARAAGVQCIQQKRCQGAQAVRAAYLERLGQAQTKADLTAQLAEVKTVASQSEKAIGMADSLAAVTGGDRAQIANVVGIVVSLLMLAALELAATFSGDAGLLLSDTIAKSRLNRRLRGTSNPEAISEDEDTGPASRQSTRLSEAQALLKLQMMIWHAPGEQLVMNRNTIADELGIKRSTFGDWCRKWIAQGKIQTRGSGRNAALIAPSQTDGAIKIYRRA